MLIERVHAYAFGPLHDQTLELAPGLTIVHGPNESAKSSWHAAIQAAICGRRRGRGRLGEDARFAQRHKPWDRDAWDVGAVLLLDDGRRVELRRDLADGGDGRAIDLGLGTDVTAEIVHDGAPDAARWLGLDRAAFLATACIGQAQLLDVRQRAGALQEHIQRAADTAGADETAAAAIAAIEAYQQEHVGSEGRNAVKPLRRAINARQGAAAAVTHARAARAEHERCLVELAQLRAEAGAAHRLVALHEAVAAAAAAQRLRARADEAAALDAALGGRPPRREDGEANTARVAAALAAWRARPPAPAADGAAGPLADAELFDLAQRLDTPPTPPDPDLDERVLDSREALARLRRQRRRAGLAALAAAALLAGAGGLAWSGRAGLAVLAGLLGLGAALLAATGAVAGRRRGEAEAAHATLERQQADGQRIRRDELVRRREAEARCAELGVPAEPEQLRALARRSAGDAQVRQLRAEVDALRARAEAEVLAAAEACGLAVAAPAEAVAALQEWERGRAARDREHERASGDWARLVALLDGRSAADLLADAADAENRAAKLGDGFSASELALTRTDEGWLTQLRSRASAAAARALAAEATVEERARNLPALAEAEEALARAEAEESRVRDLDAVLTTTRRFLAQAQERVHRDIAPRLAAAVGRWLPALTAGRYTEAIVDPQTLAVTVRGPQGRLREAHLLSHGTAEQIYLLLRVALAAQLSRPGTSCPLLLDDVTVHADAERTQRLLELLLAVAADHQIVLFTQQDQVRDWARTHPVTLRPLPPVPH